MRSIRCRTDSSPPNGTLSIRGQGAAYVVRRDASGVGLRRLLANGVDSVFEDVARSRLPMAEMLGTCSDRSPPERRYYADGEGEQEVERGTTRVRGDPLGCRRQAPRPHGRGRVHAPQPDRKIAGQRAVLALGTGRSWEHPLALWTSWDWTTTTHSLAGSDPVGWPEHADREPGGSAAFAEPHFLGSIPRDAPPSAAKLQPWERSL